MFSALLAIAFGLLLLLAGGELLLRGAVAIAKLCRLSPAVIGLTVVAAGTSVPELAVSVLSAWQGKPDIAIGNVVGSNILNICIILGLTALLGGLRISGSIIKLEYPVLLLVTFACVLLCRDGTVGRLDALFFFGVYVAFTAYLVRVVGTQATAEERQKLAEEIEEIEQLEETLRAQLREKRAATIFTVAGIALLAIGADKTVSGAVSIGQMCGMSEAMIGLTIVALGTSLPELVTSLVSRYRGRDDIAIANVIGSNIFNILGILGLTGMILPLQVPEGVVRLDNWWMLGATVLLFPIMHSGFTITRREGGVLLGIYGAYFVSLLVR